MPADDQSAQTPVSNVVEPVRIGARVLATDGDSGELVRVVVDPIAQAVTHLVVAPRHRAGEGRLVPFDLIEAADEDQIRLSLTRARFQELDDAEDVQFLPATTGALGYGQHALVWPYYSLGASPSTSHHRPIRIDRVPAGEVEVRRGDPVHATDGWIGSVQGLVIDPEDHHVTHVLLQEGHLWGRKQVAIPVGKTSRVGEEIRVDLTKQRVEELPPVELGAHP